jgi:hypothetical protein
MGRVLTSRNRLGAYLDENKSKNNNAEELHD